VINSFKSLFNEYPKSFRILVGATFIDRLGGALIFPFLSLYIAQKFNVGMTQVGLLFGIWSASSLIGSIIGGALADRLGRKVMLIFGLIFSATTAILLGVVNDLKWFFLLTTIAGFFSDMGHPAQQAMVADLLPGKTRSEGFAMLRVVANLAIVFGPVIGGFLAGIVSYTTLFIIDAFASLTTAAIVYYAIPETKPERALDHKPESMVQTLAGYATLIKDRLFVTFVMVSILMILVYTQMYSTLSVFLNRVHQVPASGFGMMMSMNALMVVLFQFWISRKIKAVPPMLLMMAGTALYGIGFTMFGFVSTFGLFMLAMAIITIGEMIHIPTSQSLAAMFAPEDMRGRYMAFFGLSWTIPNIFGSFFAGLVMDNFNPNYVWYIAGILSLVALLGYAYLHSRSSQRFATANASIEKTAPSVIIGGK